MKLKILIFFLFASLTSFAQQASSWQQVKESGKGTLNVYYFENYPFAYTNAEGKLTGIEIDIIEVYCKWLRASGGFEVNPVFKKFVDFNEFYTAMQSAPNGTVGLGSVSMIKERADAFTFTPPYLKNVSVLISSLETPTLVSLKRFQDSFGNMKALAVKGSTHEKELLEIKTNYFNSMKIEYVSSPSEMLRMMHNDKEYYGYVDIVTYWDYLKSEGGDLKMHKVASVTKETFGMVLPKNSDWYTPFQQFYESGFGFSATETYMNILKNHLPFEVIKSVALD